MRITKHHAKDRWTWSINTGRRVIIIALAKRWNDLWYNKGSRYFIKIGPHVTEAGNRGFRICIYLLNILIGKRVL